MIQNSLKNIKKVFCLINQFRCFSEIIATKTDYEKLIEYSDKCFETMDKCFELLIWQMNKGFENVRNELNEVTVVVGSLKRVLKTSGKCRS